MKRVFAACIAYLLFFPTGVFAVATAPEFSVWVMPERARAGETVKLNAFVYNSTDVSATVTVVFKEGTETIDTQTIEINRKTAVVASASWKMPKQKTQVTVEIVKAIDVKKKAIPQLVGVVATAPIKGSDTKSSLSLPSEVTLKRWAGSVLDTIEPFRIKQAKRYKAVRDRAKAALGLTTSEVSVAPNDTPEAPAVPQTDQTTPEGSLSAMRELNIESYGTYLYGTVLSSFFSNIAVFYISIVIIFLLILRFIFGRLF